MTINGTKLNHPIIGAMDARVGIDFYLTGSRFFGDQREDSDWDFYTIYSKETAHFLNDLGFRYLVGGDYQQPEFDIFTQGIMYWEDIKQRYWQRIEVKLIKDEEHFQLFQVANDVVKKYPGVVNRRLVRSWNFLRDAIVGGIIIQDARMNYFGLIKPAAEEDGGS